MAKLPTVRDGILVLPGGNIYVHVGSPEWVTWLQDAHSFTFIGADGTLTARREERSGSYFWYAYRRQNGILRKHYLGRWQDLSQSRLEQVAGALTDHPTPKREAAVQWASALIATKISMPQPGSALISRPALIVRCMHAIEKPCLFVTAPAGFGKTTLLIEMCAQIKQRGWRVAWLALEETERDPARFWTYILATLEGAQPGISKLARQMPQIPRPQHVEGLLTALINGLALMTVPLVLVLDDYHLASMPAIDQGLTFLLDHAPATLHIIVAARAEPGLPLSRLRAQGRIAEIRTIDLRFSADEATRFLSETMRLSLPPAHLATLVKRTEGWVAGLQLAALSLREQAGGFDLPTEAPRYIAEYLVGEVLDRQNAEVRAFLLQTSMLDRLSGPLCSAVTQNPDGAAMLARLMQAQLFITPLDAGMMWFRYHHLFAAVLRERFQREDATAYRACHQRAAQWFHQATMLSEAIHHFIAAQAYDDAAQLIAEEGDRLILRGETLGLVAWVRALPREVVLRHPHIGVLFVAGLIFQSERADAEAWLSDLARSTSADGTLTPRLQGEITVARAFLLLIAGRLVEAADMAEVGVQQIPPDDRLMRALGIWLVNITGVIGYADITEVGRKIAEIGDESLRIGNIMVAYMALITLAGLEVYQGRLHRAVQTCQETLRIVPTVGGEESPMVAMTYCLLGDIRREWNDLDGAEAAIQHALEIGSYPSNAEFLNDGLITLALILAERGQGDEALAAFEEHRYVIRTQQLAQLDIPQMEIIRLRVLLMHGHITEAIHWAEECRASRVGRAPQFDMPMLRWEEDLALSRVALARGDGAAEIAPLEDLCAQARAANRIRDVLEARILLARAHDMAGNQDAAMRNLALALDLAAPEGFMRLFLDEGPHVAVLLASYVATQPPSAARTHALKLIVAFGGTIEAPPGAQQALLSGREVDVLRQLALGRSNKAIAAELVLTVSTVKWHIARIYRKLGVASRVQAITRAREQQLIG